MKRRGFTLIELIIAVVLIAILATLVALSVIRLRESAKLSRVSTELGEISSALNEYAQDNNYQYPPDTSRNVPPGLEKYLAGGVWPISAWPHGQFDWDNWYGADGTQVYQISYHICGTNDPVSYCSDPVLFPNFVQDSSIFYCISGPCIPHQNESTIPGYCVNCVVKPQNYTPTGLMAR